MIFFDARLNQLSSSILGTSAPRYDGIILTEGNLAYEENGQFKSVFDDNEWNILYTFENQFRIRELVMYTFPTSRYGLEFVETRPAGILARLTTSGKGILPYVPVAASLAIETYGYLARPLAGNTPLITDTDGRIAVSLYTNGNREFLVSTFDNSVNHLHTLLFID